MDNKITETKLNIGFTLPFIHPSCPKVYELLQFNDDTYC